MMNTNQVTTVKSQLAKLLATENITVRHQPGAQTAGFDVKQRLLILPVWNNISNDLYDMLVVHEVGHALDTPADAWMSGVKDIAKRVHQNPNILNETSIKMFMNVVEDARVDKRQKRRYPGSRTNYLVGYKELFDRNFFGIQGKEVNTLSFIDRANIYYKGGTMLNIQFSPQEKIYLKRMGETETFDEVIALTEEIYKYAKDVEKNLSTKSFDALTFYEADEDAEECDGFAMEMDEDELEDLMDKSKGKGDSDSDEDGEDGDEDGDGNASEASDEKKDGENKEQGDIATQSHVGGGSNNKNDDFVAPPETEVAAEKSALTIVASDDVNYIHLKLPKWNYENIIEDYSVVLPRFEKGVERTLHNYGNITEQNRKMDAELNELATWRAQEKDTISFMVKEFELRKSADAYSKTSIAKTGVIDTNKIHSYKYNDDIFRRFTVVPTGKNHGFVLLLDWSGSMIGNLKSTLKQVFSLVLFCRQVQIPFEVYFFRSGGYGDHNLNNQQIHEEGRLQFDKFKVCNILSSRMNLNQMNRAMKALWLSALWHPYHDALDSTPLNQSILVLDKIINDFTKKNRLQVVSAIVLTDGGSDPTYAYYSKVPAPYRTKKPKGDVYILTDDVTKKNYYFNTSPYGWYYDGTNTFLRILKDRTNANVIGFYLHSGGLMSLSHMIDGNYLCKQSTKEFWKTNNFISAESAGYDEYYVMNAGALDQSKKDLSIAPTMTKAAKLKEFIRYSEKKAVNRVMLSSFMKRVSSEKKWG